MTTDEELRAAILRERSIPDRLPAVLRWVTVTAVNQEEQTMDATGITDGLEFFDVQLGVGSVVIYPAIGAACLVAIVEGQPSDAFLLSASEVERIEVTASASIVMNGGYNGGLINIDALTEKINTLVDTFNKHTHQVSTTGSATSQTGTAAAITTPADKLKREDYEDKLITH